jgi:HEAT repeat protein
VAEEWQLRRLGSADDRVRDAALEVLADMGSRRAARRLAADLRKEADRLLGEDPEVALWGKLAAPADFPLSARTHLAAALEGLAKASGIELLLPDVLKEIAVEGGVDAGPLPAGPRPAAEFLDLVLERAPWDITWFAMGGKGFEIAPLRFDRSPRLDRLYELWTSRALSRLGAAAVPELLALARDPFPRVRLAAVYTLGWMRDDARDAVPDLRRFLEGGDPLLRTWAAVALGAIGPDAAPALPELREAMRSRSRDLAFVASTAVLMISEMDGLCRLLEDPDARVRHAAASFLRHWNPTDAMIAALTRALDDECPWVRIAAARSLRAVTGDPETAASVLRMELDGADRAVRASARRALTALGRP